MSVLSEVIRRLSGYDLLFRMHETKKHAYKNRYSALVKLKMHKIVIDKAIR